MDLRAGELAFERALVLGKGLVMEESWGQVQWKKEVEEGPSSSLNRIWPSSEDEELEKVFRLLFVSS